MSILHLFQMVLWLCCAVGVIEAKDLEDETPSSILGRNELIKTKDSDSEDDWQS